MIILPETSKSENDPYPEFTGPGAPYDRPSSEGSAPTASSTSSSPYISPAGSSRPQQYAIAQYTPSQPPPYGIPHGAGSSSADDQFRDIKVANWRTGTSDVQSSYSTSSYYAQPPAMPSQPEPSASQVRLPYGSASGPRGISSSPQLLDPSTSRDPIPSSFSRQPPQHLPYSSFQPIFLIANGKYLEKGFPQVAPPSDVQPHPFASHDVNEGDWMRFLDDLKVAGTLTSKQKTNAHSLPLVSIVPIVNILVGMAITTHMRKNKGKSVGERIDKWNHHFFHPRKMEVVLMQGQVRISGQNNVPIPNLHVPKTVDLSTLSSASSRDARVPGRDSQGSSGGEDGRNTHGKSREEKEDKTFRLFVAPL